MYKSFAGVAATLVVCLVVQADAGEKIDLSVVNRIKAEAFGDSAKVMDEAFYLTDVYGPRLTGSPNIKAAAEWAVKRMNEWGLSNVKMETWGPFGRGWSCTRFTAMQKEPGFSPLIGFSQPWSPGTDGPVSGQAMIAVINTREDFDKFKGKLKGKIILIATPHPSELELTPLAHRLTDAELAEAAAAPDPSTGNPAVLPLGFTPGAIIPPPRRVPSGAQGGQRDRESMRRFRGELNKFLTDEGVLVVLRPGTGPDGGTVMGSAAGSQDPKEALPPPSVILTNEHYNRIARLIDKKIPVTLEFDIQNKFTEPADSFNITAEIPGTNPDAGFVMLGGHFDSWTGGTGATDNGAGSAVAMEAMRILKALDLKMARTVRIGLWTAEEEGLLGSRAYVKEHFADPTDMKLKPEHAKISGYFNLDNGSGRIRGIYMQDNDMMRPIFEAWLEPFKDLGVTTLTIRNTGSTDHVSFDAVGIPAFQFIQDPLEYGTRTHHSNMDVYDHLQQGDLEQAAAVMAWTVYNTATRPEMLPRKALPKPKPNRGQGGERPENTNSSSGR
ncbi:MAG TPA: M20/M25/M40 family metallo-hydrolase [Bryobacteraceae bacterium]|nr:M20/M25/M40 family metallo-hydrolase [Bryobacteraceae bacterium]